MHSVSYCMSCSRWNFALKEIGSFSLFPLLLGYHRQRILPASLENVVLSDAKNLLIVTAVAEMLEDLQALVNQNVTRGNV